jgi:predicted secreted protein
MSWLSGIFVYLLIWWTALFVVLPIGTRPVDLAAEDGGWRGAPERPMILRKVVGTTILAAILWLGVFAVIESGWVSFRDGWWAYTGPGSSAVLPGSSAQN